MASIDKVTIGNMALSHIGADSTIENFNENSTEAGEIDLWYDYSRLQTLEAFDWSFARTRVILATHEEDPPAGIWAFRYQYPSDAVVVRRLPNPAGPRAAAIPFSIEMDGTKSTKTIVTDLEDATVVYTFDQETTTLFSSHFVETLSRLLASRIAMAITTKKKVADDNFSIWQGMIIKSEAVDANEEMQRAPDDAEWIKVR